MAFNQLRSVALDKILATPNRPQTPAYPVANLGWAKLFIIIVFTTVVVLTGCVVIWSHVQITTYNYQISELYQERKELANWQRKLRVELNYLQSLERLERLAVEQYNMAPPEPHQVINLR